MCSQLVCYCKLRSSMVMIAMFIALLSRVSVTCNVITRISIVNSVKQLLVCNVTCLQCVLCSNLMCSDLRPHPHEIIFISYTPDTYS